LLTLLLLQIALSDPDLQNPKLLLADRARVLADRVRNVGQHLHAPEAHQAPANVRLEFYGEELERLANDMDEPCAAHQGGTVPDLRNQARPAIDRLERATQELAHIENELIRNNEPEADESRRRLTRARDDIESATRTLKLLIETSSP